MLNCIVVGVYMKFAGNSRGMINKLELKRNHSSCKKIIDFYFLN